MWNYLDRNTRLDVIRFTRRASISRRYARECEVCHRHLRFICGDVGSLGIQH
jgi:hypothetical protein